VNPPPIFSDSHPSLILVEHGNLDHSLFEMGFDFSQLLVTCFDKCGDAAR
jgi:hypothetical protein